jgi:hypothetical protein
MREEDPTEDRVSLQGLDPLAALKALLAVDPDAPPVDAKGKTQPKSADSSGPPTQSN